MAFGPLLVAGVTLKDLSLTGVDARLVLALPPPLLLPENEDIKYMRSIVILDILLWIKGAP